MSKDSGAHLIKVKQSVRQRMIACRQRSTMQQECPL